MSLTTDLRDAVKVYYGGELSVIMRGLTNIDGDNSATTIDNTVLDAHCEHAIGRFRFELGLTPDIDNFAHKNLLITGVRASLESAAGRDSSIMRDTETRFRNLLITFRKKMRGRMQSSSRLKPSTEVLNSLPDSDPTQVAFSNTKRSGSTIREVNE